MKYETPELTISVPAIDLIQITRGTKSLIEIFLDNPFIPDSGGGYEDWE